MIQGNSNPIVLNHDLGRFADQAALEAKYATGRPGDYATLTSTGTIWSWDPDTEAWVDSLVPGPEVPSAYRDYDVQSSNPLAPAAGKVRKFYNNGFKQIDEDGNVRNIDPASVVSQAIFGRSPAYWFDNADDNIKITDNAAIHNIFDNGGSISAFIFPNSDGEDDKGKVLSKYAVSAGWRLQVAEESSGFVKIQFRQEFSITDGIWSTGLSVQLGKWTHVAVVYDNSDTGNDPAIFINGELVEVLETSTPEGIRNSDVGEDLYIGNLESGTSTFDGSIASFKLLNRVLTSQDIINYFFGMKEWADEGADGIDLLSGWDFTDGNWGYNNNAVIIDNNTFTTNGISGSRINKLNLLEIGKRYKLKIDGSVTAGKILVYLSNGLIGTTKILEDFGEIEFVANDFHIVLVNNSVSTNDITTLELIEVGIVAEFSAVGIGQTGWTGIIGGEKFTAQNNGATPFNLPIDHAPEFITNPFTTDIQSGIGSKVIIQPAGYEVEDIIIIDKGTAGGLSAIQVAQETSGINLISGKALGTGETMSFRRSIVDHNVYSVDKNLTFTYVGNGGSGSQIHVKFRRVN